MDARPLERLRDRTDRIRQTDLRHRIDGIGQLASVFDGMFADLEKQQADPQKQNNEIASACQLHKKEVLLKEIHNRVKIIYRSSPACSTCRLAKSQLHGPIQARCT